MNNRQSMFKKLLRYIIWKIEYINKPPYFPIWCDTGNKSPLKSEYRHFIDDETIVWNTKNEKSIPHYDHIEMSGFYASSIISYGVDKKGALKLYRHCVYPMYRKIPNNTEGSLSHSFPIEVSAQIKVNSEVIEKEYPETIKIKGYLEIDSATNKGIKIKRKIIPSVNYPAIIEKIIITNETNTMLKIEVNSPNYCFNTPVNKGISGSYQIRAALANDLGVYSSKEDYNYAVDINPGEASVHYLVFSASKNNETITFNVLSEESNRDSFIDDMFTTLNLETPEESLNTTFNYAKIRSCESIFKTKGGLMHCPGGGSFYAALWTNDQCEYMNPLIPFIGYKIGNEQAKNSYKMFMEKMDENLEKPLITSIVAEGDDIWNGAGDRGDGAMFSYGAARFALAYGDYKTAEELWNGIKWGIEYSLKKKNSQGVILSDSDELENRFKSGDANLFTSSLLYDALKSAIYLGQELGKDNTLLNRYEMEAEELRHSIDKYFGKEVEGYNTYSYYKGNDVLRAWICVPLTMGIYDRAEETVKALFSDKLWTIDGLRTQSNKNTFWDRSTLYALRGVFAVGETDIALRYLLEYSKERLLGEHVPYPIEAYPEGNQKHLSAESGLYLRVFTEGLFGIRPVGFKSFEINPKLPMGWKHMALRNINAFQTKFHIEVYNEGELRRIKIIENDAVIYDEVSKNDDVIQINLLNKKSELH